MTRVIGVLNALHFMKRQIHRRFYYVMKIICLAYKLSKDALLTADIVERAEKQE